MRGLYGSTKKSLLMKFHRRTFVWRRAVKKQRWELKLHRQHVTGGAQVLGASKGDPVTQQPLLCPSSTALLHSSSKSKSRSDVQVALGRQSKLYSSWIVEALLGPEAVQYQLYIVQLYGTFIFSYPCYFCYIHYMLQLLSPLLLSSFSSHMVYFSVILH